MCVRGKLFPRGQTFSQSLKEGEKKKSARVGKTADGGGGGGAGVSALASTWSCTAVGFC